MSGSGNRWSRIETNIGSWSKRSSLSSQMNNLRYTSSPEECFDRMEFWFEWRHFQIYSKTMNKVKMSYANLFITCSFETFRNPSERMLRKAINKTKMNCGAITANGIPSTSQYANFSPFLSDSAKWFNPTFDSSKWNENYSNQIYQINKFCKNNRITFIVKLLKFCKDSGQFLWVTETHHHLK